MDRFASLLWDGGTRREAGPRWLGAYSEFAPSRTSARAFSPGFFSTGFRVDVLLAAVDRFPQTLFWLGPGASLRLWDANTIRWEGGGRTVVLPLRSPLAAGPSYQLSLRFGTGGFLRWAGPARTDQVPTGAGVWAAAAASVVQVGQAPGGVDALRYGVLTRPLPLF